MDLRELVNVLRARDALGAREWVAAAQRDKTRLSDLKKPDGLDATDLAIAAGAVELLAGRWGQLPPAWAAAVPAAPEPFFLVRAATQLPRLRRMCETEGPEPLRRRRLFAPPDFLTAA